MLYSHPFLDRAGARAAASGGAGRSPIPRGFAVYAGFAILYGICETLNGNWSQLDMTTEVGASTTVAAVALTTFWAMVTLGRILFASIERRFPATRTYRVLPFFLAGAFVLIASLDDASPAVGVVAFGLAGLGCSALLPLTISFAGADLVAISDDLFAIAPEAIREATVDLTIVDGRIVHEALSR